MPPEKAWGRLRQSEVFFPLAHHAIVANHVVQPGIYPVLVQNRPDLRSCQRPLREKVWPEKFNIIASIILFSKYYSITHYKRLPTPVTE